MEKVEIFAALSQSEQAKAADEELARQHKERIDTYATLEKLAFSLLEGNEQYPSSEESRRSQLRCSDKYESVKRQTQLFDLGVDPNTNKSVVGRLTVHEQWVDILGNTGFLSYSQASDYYAFDHAAQITIGYFTPDAATPFASVSCSADYQILHDSDKTVAAQSAAIQGDLESVFTSLAVLEANLPTDN